MVAEVEAGDAGEVARILKPLFPCVGGEHNRKQLEDVDHEHPSPPPRYVWQLLVGKDALQNHQYTKGKDQENKSPAAVHGDLCHARQQAAACTIDIGVIGHGKHNGNDRDRECSILDPLTQAQRIGGLLDSRRQGSADRSARGIDTGDVGCTVFFVVVVRSGFSCLFRDEPVLIKQEDVRGEHAKRQIAKVDRTKDTKVKGEEKEPASTR